MSDLRRKYGGQKPKKVDGQLTARTDFYRTQLRKIIKGLFEVECPEDWNTDYLLNLLCIGGYVLIADSAIGVMPFKSSPIGYNYTGDPTEALVSVPTMPHFKVKLGETGQLLFLERTPLRQYFNFTKVMDVYAEKLASADCGIDVNLMNSRMAYLIAAENKAQADTIKEIYDKISNGDPMVVYKRDTLSKDGLQAFFGNVRNTYIAGEIEDTKRTIMCEFLTSIGINNANMDKKERLITDEANSNNIEIMANTALWKDNLERCVNKVNKLFPSINFNLTMRFDLSNLKEKGVLLNDSYGQRGAVGDTNGNQRT